MYTSDIDRRAWCVRALIFTSASVLCAVLGAIYELFAHGVYSYAMLYAFAIPLVGGALPSLIMACLGRPCRQGISFELYAFALASACVGSIVCGVLEIYGTSNRLLMLFFILSALSALGAAATAIISAVKRRRASLDTPDTN